MSNPDAVSVDALRERLNMAIIAKQNDTATPEEEKLVEQFDVALAMRLAPKHTPN